jgi:hypothetical protein
LALNADYEKARSWIEKVQKELPGPDRVAKEGTEAASSAEAAATIGMQPNSVFDTAPVPATVADAPDAALVVDSNPTLPEN